MRAVIVSDTHGYHNDLIMPYGDILIHAGDFSMGGSAIELERFNEWLGSLPYEHKIVIAGNHDWCFYKNNEESRKLLTNATYLQDESVTINDIKFYGAPWQPEFHNWAFNLPRDGKQLEEKWEQIPDDTDVLITHGPPFNVLDEVGYGNEKAGCKKMLDRILKIKPKFHIFGHIHEQGGRDLKFNNTHFINASSLNFNYMVCGKPIVVDIK